MRRDSWIRQNFKLSRIEIMEMKLDWNHAPVLHLSAIAAGDLKAMAGRLRDRGFESTSNELGTVMLTVKDSFDTPFHVGEVLVRQVVTAYRNAVGYGITVGDNENGAFIAACADAAGRAGDLESAQDIQDWIEARAHFYQDQVKAEEALVKSTRVNFGFMVEG
jgi:phosphonate C-P lyase system protein PhnG